MVGLASPSTAAGSMPEAQDHALHCRARHTDSSERLGRHRANAAMVEPISPPRHAAHEQRADIHEVFVIRGCALICLKKIRKVL